MSVSEYEIIFNQRHPELKKKDSIWNLIYKSYLGGQEYIEADFLFRNPKESLKSFEKRKERSVYFNQIEPLASLLAGFLFLKPPIRNDVINFNYIIDSANLKGKSLNEFSKIVATYSLLFTCGVLVESPDFDPEQIITKKDRIENKINPYCLFYLPFQIRNFHIDKNGMLKWIILDNSYYENSNYMERGYIKKIYKLWTTEFYQDFEQNDEGVVLAYEPRYHNLGEVPFKFTNWKDDNSDFIAESVFEDPALISRLIYNKMSEMDEMTASGAIKVLMYPSEDGEIPPSLIAGGIGAMSAIPYLGSYAAPNFDGAKLDDVEPFLKTIEFYIAEILKKIGLNTDETKEYVKSGIAKKIDFQKVKTLLVSGSIMMQELEKWIFSMIGKWEGKKDIYPDIVYPADYDEQDIQSKVNLLNQVLIYPFEKLRKKATKLLVDTILSDDLNPDELNEIHQEIEQDKKIDIDSLVEKQKDGNIKESDGENNA